MNTNPTTPVRLDIEQVIITNDAMAEAGIEVNATAAVCYDDDGHIGVHFVTVGTDISARSFIEAQIIDSGGFPYEIRSRGNVEVDVTTAALAALAEG